MLSRRILLIAYPIAIIIGTTLLFEKTQAFYKSFIQGKVYFDRKVYNKAVPYLVSALKIKPTDIKTSLYLLWTYEKLGRKKEAQVILDEITKNYPEDADLELQLADSYYDLADYSAAEKKYRESLSRKPSFNIKKKFAETLIWQKKYDEGIPILEQLAKERPGDSKLLEFLADTYSWAKKYDAAIEIYSGLIKKGFRTKEISFKLAEALRFAGRDEEALEIYNKYLKH